MSLNVAKCNFSKVKLRANVVCVLPLKRMRSVGWTQGPLLTLWLAMHFMLAFWADLCGSGVKANLCRFWLSLSPSLPFWGCAIPLVWLCQLVFACTGVCMHGWFPLTGLPWIPPCYAWEGTSSQAHLLAMSSMSPTDDGTAIVLGQIRATWRSSRLQGKGSTFNSQLS